MELYLFIIGFLVSCLVIASVFLVNKEEKDKYRDSDKAMKWTMMEWEIMVDFHKKISLLFSCSYKTFYKIDHCHGGCNTHR